MRSFHRTLAASLLSATLALSMSGCGLVMNAAKTTGETNVSTTSTTASVAIAVSGPASVTLGTRQQYAATVTGSSDTQVAWSVNGVRGGSAAAGTIDEAGVYVAPEAAPGASTVAITATSHADSSTSQSIAVGLVAPAAPPIAAPVVALTLSGPTSVTLGTSSQYAANVTGTSETTVQWSVNGIPGGSPDVGTIGSDGLYVAPVSTAQPGEIRITATSIADATKAQTLAVALITPVVAPAPVQAPVPPPVTVTLTGSTSVLLGATAKYTAVVSGSSNPGLIWTVNGNQGGTAAYGTITSAGVYTAPKTLPQPGTVQIGATSVADSSKSQSLAVVLVPPAPAPPAAPVPVPVTISLTGPASVTLGKTAQYSATVGGSTNKSVVWSVNGVQGGTLADGAISGSGLYTPPPTLPSPSTITVTATSAADSSASKTLPVALVAPPPVTPVAPSRIPANAVSSGALDASPNWQWNHDPGTPGSSQGSTVYPITGLSPDGAARQYAMNYSGYGGEIYHLSFANDTVSTHFIYDAYVYVADPAQLGNLEMDMNQVLADGRTVIFGTQCSSYSKTWEYTEVANGGTHWYASNIPCNPQKWAANTWRHIQIASHRDAAGNVTYDWVGVDGVYTDFQNATGNSALSLGWAHGVLLLNFQIDGALKTSGAETIYTDKLQIYRW